MHIQLDGDMDRIMTAQVIRTQFDIPSLFLSAFIGEETEARAILTKPEGHLPKPFSEYELGAAIAEALGAN